MPRAIDRFLRHKPDIADRPTLGRIFSVVRQSWHLSDDPALTPPQVEVLATRRSAADAADLARDAAGGFARRGYHKPSRAWWGVEGDQFHRFLVEGPRARTGLLLVAVSGLAALATVGLVSARRSPRKEK